MGIPILCTCGRQLQVPEDIAGKEYRCPYCEHFVYIPTLNEDKALFRWYCECGQRLKARRVSAGRAINCPRCGQRCIVPNPESKTAEEESEEASAILLEDDEARPIAQETMTCSQCGMQLTTDQEECPECGAPLLDEDEEAAHSETRIIREQVYTEDEDEEESRVRDLLNVSAGAEAESESSVFPRVEPVAVEPAIAAAAEEESSDEEFSLEGLGTTDLSVFFRETGGFEAAVAGGRQVLSSFGFYLAYAGFAAVFAGLYGLAFTHWAQPPALKWTLVGLFGLVSFALLAGFVGCIRDSIFQHDIGLERVLYDAVMNFVVFLLAFLVTAPLWAAAAYGAFVLFHSVWSMAGDFMVKALLTAGLVAAMVFVFELLALTPALAALHRVSPFEALGRAFRFGKRHFLPALIMSITLFLIGGGVVGIALLIRNLASPALKGLPPFAAKGIMELLGALLAVGLAGAFLTSLMLLYASNLGDEASLQRIHRHCAGPRTRPWLLWVSVVLLFAVAIALTHYRMNVVESAFAAPRALAVFKATSVYH